jgi:hypothetical protein
LSRGVSRRGALRAAGLGCAVAALGAGAVSGCDLDPGSSSKPPAVPPPDPDQDILDAARAELGGLLEWLPATPGTAALVACHRQQLEALQGEAPTRVRHRRLTRAQVVARERRAATRFSRWAVTAQNGDLARVLASVSAGISMQPWLHAADADESGPKT